MTLSAEGFRSEGKFSDVSTIEMSSWKDSYWLDTTLSQISSKSFTWKFILERLVPSPNGFGQLFSVEWLYQI